MKPSRFRLILISALFLFVLPLTLRSQTAMPQSTLWRVLVGDHDRMTVVNSTERAWFLDEGQVYYIPACQPLNTTPIYRLWDWSTYDHRDSLYDIPGSVTEWPEGCGWNPGTLLQGLSPIFETVNTRTGDYSITKPGEALPGYTATKNLGLMGYPRYGNEKEVLLTIRGKELSVDSNLVAGGSVWHWTWNGLQFLNTAGYTRGMHSLISGIPGREGITGAAYESGDFNSFFPDLPSNVHGAPLILATNSGKTQSTLAVPLEYNAPLWGGDEDHPVLWQDIVLGKELTLDFHGDSSVARYRAYMVYPNPAEFPGLITEIYLRGLFTRYFTYDAALDQLTEITADLQPCAPAPPPGYGLHVGVGGVVVANATGQYAIGLYGADPAFGGSLSSFGIRPRICPEQGADWANPESPESLSYVGVRFAYTGPITQEKNSFDRYIVTNTLANVRASMRRLYLTGVR